MRVAVDLGGTHVRAAAGLPAEPWRFAHTSRRPQGMTPEALVGLLGEVFATWNLPGGRPRSIGVSVAAVVDRNGILHGSENLGWSTVPLARVLQDAFGCPVGVDTDVFCGALFEAREGAARGVSSALYVGVGTGVGHALIVEGRVWRGAHGGANALGHLVLDRDGPPCYCGNRGCLCQTASGLAQAERPPSIEPLEALAHGLGSAVTLFEPEIVILSGGALNQPWLALDGLAHLLPRFSYPATRLPPLVRSPVPDPNLRGALQLGMEFR